MAKKITVAGAASRWVSGMGSATTKMKAGAQAVTTPPGQAAAARADAYVAGVQRSLNKYKTNVASVSLSSWQQDYITKGLPRVASGAQQAQPKFQAFMTAFAPVIESAVASAPARGTYEQNKARMVSVIDSLHQFQYKK